MRARCGVAGGLGWARLAASRQGSTAIEYALLASVVALIAFGSLMTLAGPTGALHAVMRQISDAIAGAVSG